MTCIGVTLMLMAMRQPAQAQTYTVLHDFSGVEGAKPYAGLVMDRAGNLYGTASAGGKHDGPCQVFGGCGTVFKLSHIGSSWILNPLHTFTGDSDGSSPTGRVTFGPDGALYGTTSQGGGAFNCSYGCGTVFRMTPQPTICKTSSCPWIENVVYAFQGGGLDGAGPGYGDVMFDPVGDLYGTTVNGGGGLCNDSTCGTVYKLAHSGGAWTEAVLYHFYNGPGYWPYPGVIRDGEGNLYGATTWNFSSVFELTQSGGGWAANPLYVFSNYQRDGSAVAGGLIFDQAGNLFGSTSFFGPEGGGTVFELSPSAGAWTLTTLYAFTGAAPGPTATLTMDPSGNLYGITNGGGQHGAGSVFKLSHSGGPWVYTSLHDFTGGTDGSQPYGQVVLDNSGNIYGTTTHGGTTGSGVVYEITP